jgi:alkylation response protein AidB-like acyl-CoA dehydrogenase
MSRVGMVGVDEYRRRARIWLGQVKPPDLGSSYEERFAGLRRWQRVLYDAGWVGIHWPREVGGGGLSMHHTLAFAEELVRARLPQPVGSIGVEVIGPTILRHGSNEQRNRFLPQLLSGVELWGQGFSEPGAGSDLAGLRTRAIRDGDTLIVTGQKVWTSWATDADFCAVLARTDLNAGRHNGISYLIVDMRAPGVTVRPIRQMTGDPEFNEIFFDDVAVPLENVVGGLGGGWQLAMDTLGHERSGYAIRRRMENESAFIDLVDALRAAGPGAVPDARAAIGELFVSLKKFEAQSRATATRLADGEGPTPIDSLDKLSLTATEQQLYAVASNLLGVERMVVGARPWGARAEDWIKGLLYARSASIYGGSSQIQRSIIAERHLGLPRGR